MTFERSLVVISVKGLNLQIIKSMNSSALMTWNRVPADWKHVRESSFLRRYLNCKWVWMVAADN